MDDAQELLPCPFCGAKPQRRKTKKMQCQLHGDDYQRDIFGCFNPSCRFMPQITGSYNDVMVKAWNTRLSADDYDTIKDMVIAHNMANTPMTDQAYWNDEFEKAANKILTPNLTT